MNYNSKNNKLDRALKCTLHENVKPDDVLHQKVLHSWKEERTMGKRNYKIALAAAAAAIIGITAIGGSVYAAVTGSDILSFFRNKGSNISQDAEKLVDAAPKTTLVTEKQEFKYISYSLNEVVCDDYVIYAKVTITPKDKEKYLLADDFWVGESEDVDASQLKIDGVSGMSMQEYADSIGKKLIYVHATMLNDYPDAQECERYSRGENGELFYYISVQDNPESDTYQERLNVAECTNMDDYNGETSTITISNRSTVNNRKEYRTADSKLDNGVTVKQLSAITTELGTYITVDFTSPEWMFPVLFDEKGNEIEELQGHGDEGSAIHLIYGPLDMSKVSIGFQHSAKGNEEVGKIDGPYIIEEIR